MWWTWLACRAVAPPTGALPSGADTGHTGPSSPDRWETTCGGTPSTPTPTGLCTWVSDSLDPPGTAGGIPQLLVFGPEGCLVDRFDDRWVFEVEPDGTQWTNTYPSLRFRRVDPDGAVTTFRVDDLEGTYTDVGSAYLGPSLDLWDVVRLPDDGALVLYTARQWWDSETRLERWSADGRWIEQWYVGEPSFRGDLALGPDGVAWVLTDGRVLRVPPPVQGTPAPPEPYAEGYSGSVAMALDADGRVLLLRDEPLELWVYAAVDDPGTLVFDGGPERVGGDLEIGPDGAWVVTDARQDSVVTIDPATATIRREFTTGLNLHILASVDVAACPRGGPPR